MNALNFDIVNFIINFTVVNLIITGFAVFELATRTLQSLPQLESKRFRESIGEPALSRVIEVWA